MDRRLRLQLILDAAGGATRFLKGVRGETDHASKALKIAHDRLGALKATTRDIGAFRRLQGVLGDSRTKLAAAQQEAQRLGRAHATAERPTRSLTRALEIARSRVGALKDQEQAHALALQAVRGKLDAAGVSVDRLGLHETRLARQTRDANAALDQQVRRMGDLADRRRRMDAARARMDRTQAFAGQAAGAGTGAIGAGMAVATPVVMASRAAMGFEDAMADVRKVVDFPTPLAFRQMERDLLALSERLPVAGGELAAIMAQGARAGVARGDLLAYTEAAAKMGVAFDISSEEAGAMMATWRTAFGLQHAGVVTLADQVNALTNAHGGNAAAVADMVTRVGPLGDVAGASSATLAALAQVMNSVGVQSEIGATGIKNMLLGMTKGAAATRTQQKAFEALGLDAAVMARRMQDDAGGAITDVLSRVAGLSEDRRLSILGQLFGTESVAAISPMLSQLDLVRRNFREVGDAQFHAGSMDREYAVRAATTSNALKLAGNNVAALGVEIGSGLLPMIREASKRFGWAARNVRDFAAEHPRLARLIAIIVTVIAALLFVFGGLALALSAVLAPFALLRLSLAMTSGLFAPMLVGLWGAVTATWAWTAALLANPLTWIVLGVIAAVALLAGAAWLVIRHWGPISAFLSGVWTAVRSATASAIDFMGAVILRFAPAALMARAFAAVWPMLQAIGGRLRSMGGHLIKGLIDGVVGGIPALVRAVVAAAGRLVAGFRRRLGIRSPSRVFAGLGDDTMAGLSRGLTRSADGPVAAVARLGAGLAAALAVAAPAAALDIGARFEPPPIAFDDGPRLPGPRAPRASAAPPPVSVTINIFPRADQDARDIAREVSEILRRPNLSTFDDDREPLD